VHLSTASARVQKSWREALPTLVGRDVVLRDLHAADAAPLFELLTTVEVARFLSPPPSSPRGFERFIRWAADERRAGRHACFAVTLPTSDAAIGIFQVRLIEDRPGAAEWGFALGSPFWGRGMFEDGAALALGFAFGTMGAHRLEACAAARNERAATARCRNWAPCRKDTCANRFGGAATLTRCYGRSAPMIAPALLFARFGFLTKGLPSVSSDTT
jgi:RimJ/RimL family protein N-acetyltransferase